MAPQQSTENRDPRIWMGKRKILKKALVCMHAAGRKKIKIKKVASEIVRKEPW